MHSLPLRSLVLVSALTAPASLTAQCWDVSEDFSTTANPNGTWSYGHTQPPASNLDAPTDFTLSATSGNPQNGQLQQWWPNFGPGDFQPMVAKNVGPGSINLGSTVEIGDGDVVIHPASDNKHSVVRWTAPADDTYRINVLFTAIDQFSDDVNVHILRNTAHPTLPQSVIFSEQMRAANDSAGWPNGIFTMVTGETLEFAVGRGENSFVNDSVRLEAQVMPVTAPEIAPFGVGGVDSAGTMMTMRWTGRPSIGTAMGMGATVSPSITAPIILFFGGSNTMWDGLTLPLDLGPVLGMQGNTVYTPLRSRVGTVMHTGGGGELLLPIPDRCSLLGTVVFFQTAMIDPPANDIGVVLSNALRLTVGT